MSQPIIDEYILGYRRQFPGQVSLDVAGIYRKVHNMFAQTDINGIYPERPEPAVRRLRPGRSRTRASSTG